MLLELIKVRSLDSTSVLPESIDLASNSSPEDLVEHGVGHIVVGSSAFVFGNGKCVLNISGRPNLRPRENSPGTLVFSSKASGCKHVSIL